MYSIGGNMKTTNKSKLYLITIFVVLNLYVSNSFAEHCFEIPYEETQEDSKKANQIAFESGKLIMMSFEKLEGKRVRVANGFAEIIKENGNLFQRLHRFQHSFLQLYGS